MAHIITKFELYTESKKTKKSKKSEDCEKGEKCEKEEKVETTGLTAKQKKLPMGLQKAILKRQKK